MHPRCLVPCLLNGLLVGGGQCWEEGASQRNGGLPVYSPVVSPLCVQSPQAQGGGALFEHRARNSGARRFADVPPGTSTHKDETGNSLARQPHSWSLSTSNTHCPHAGVAAFAVFMAQRTDTRAGSPYILCDVNLLQFMATHDGMPHEYGHAPHTALCYPVHIRGGNFGTAQAGRHRPAAARGLFALGFTRSAAAMLPRNEGKGRAFAPPRGSKTPGKGHGRAHSEDTEALGAGPSLAPCTLRVSEAWGAARWHCHILLLHCPLYAQRAGPK